MIYIQLIIATITMENNMCELLEKFAFFSDINIIR